MGTVKPSSWPKWQVIARAGATGFLVAIVAYLSIALTRDSGYFAVLWPTNALLLVLLLRAPPPHWPAMVSAGLVAGFGANWITGNSFPVALGLALANSVEVICCALAMRRFVANGTLRLARVADWVQSIGICGFAAPALSGIVAAATLHAAVDASPVKVWALWFAADAVGMLALAPLLNSIRVRELARLFEPATRSKTVLILLLVAAVSTAVFAQHQFPILFLVPPVLVLAVFELGVTGANLGAIVVGLTAIGFTTTGSGPFMLIESGQPERVLILQVFIGVTAFMTQPIAAALAQRDFFMREMAQTRNELERSNRNLKVAEKIAKIGYWLVQELPDSQRDVAWSDGIRDIYGLPVGTPPLRGDEMVHPDDRDGHAERIRKTLDAGLEYEFRALRIDGGVRHVLVRGFVEGGPPPYLNTRFGVVVDVTEQRQAARSLAKSELRYRLLAENSTDMIVLLDAQMRPVYVSPAGAAITGYSESEIRALDESIVHPDDLEGHRATYRALASGASQIKLVHRFRHKDGHWIWIEGHISAIAGGDLDGARFVSTIRDVTERQESAQALEAAKQEADRANHAKSNFLASMSHEIRTPLNAVIGFTDLLLSSTLDDEQRSHTKTLHGAGQALLALINDILDISKIEAGKLELEEIAFAPTTLAQDAASLIRPQAVAKGLELVVDTAPDIPRWALGDPTRLRQILLNLLGNALKFTEQGSIKLSLARQLDGQLRFEVADTGIGISEANRTRLFQEFTQADRSTTRRFGGTGLGLSLCKRLVEGMQGAIAVESEIGSGSRFWFCLPLPEAGPPVVREVAAPQTGPGPQRGTRILVAEDLLANQVIVNAMLKAAGHEVEIVANGAAAVEAVRDGSYDLVLMDVEMPEMDGLDATRAIRNLPAGKGNLPIIALTASATGGQATACRAAGMDDFASKPFERLELLDLVARWVSRMA